MLTKIKLGISSCLLGEKVCYDGGHKLDRFITDTLGKYLQVVDPQLREVMASLEEKSQTDSHAAISGAGTAFFNYLK